MQPATKSKAKKISLASLLTAALAYVAWWFGLPTPPPLPLPQPTSPPPQAPISTPADTDVILYHNTWHKVAKVVDGDTFKIASLWPGQIFESIRVVGIDTPETVHPGKPVQPYGPEATAKATALLQEVSVRLSLPYHETPRDKYGRLLAYAELPDSTDFGATLLTAGLARTSPAYPHPRYDEYETLQTQAQQAQIGIWSTP